MLLPRFINSGDLEKGSKEGGTLEQDKEVRGNAFTSEWLPASTANKGKKQSSGQLHKLEKEITKKKNIPQAERESRVPLILGILNQSGRKLRQENNHVCYFVLSFGFLVPPKFKSDCLEAYEKSLYLCFQLLDSSAFFQGWGEGGDGEIKEVENTLTQPVFYNLKVVVMIMESSVMGSIRGCNHLLRVIVTKALFIFIPSKLLGLFGTLLTFFKYRTQCYLLILSNF